MISDDHAEFSKSSLADYMDQARIALSITSCSIDDHPLIYVNQRFCDLTGHNLDQVKGRNCRFMQRELREQDGRFRMRDFMRDPSQDQLRCALVNYRADGSPFVNLIYLSRIRSADKRECFIFASQFDASHDFSTRLEHYDTDLRTVTNTVGKIASEHDLMMDQSVEMIANSARMIAESKLALKRMQRAQ